MYFDERAVNAVRERLADPASETLFEGRLSYSEYGDEEVLGRALADYFRTAGAGARADSPELFALMDAAFEKGYGRDRAVMATERQDRFFRGLGAAPESFTDIYDCYFASGIISLSPDEEFVDGGAQDLFTSFRFARKARGRYRAIYAFEPDTRNYVECAGNRELFDGRLHLYKLALSDRAASLPFLEDRQNSRIDERGGYEVFADTLDHCLADASPSFIKLHLEGGELAALRGAEGIIRRNSPKVAVCLDHRPGDIVDIPALLLSYNPDYRFRLRHYSSSITETILYATT